MKTRRSFFLVYSLIFTLFFPGICWSQQAKDEPDIYSGFYIREDSQGKVEESSGHSHYIKFYPEKRIVRLYIPYPYSKTLKVDVIDAVFDAAAKKTNKSAFLKDKFGLLEKRAVAHLDFVRQVKNETMFDCGKAAPCRIKFNDGSMTIIKPGIVMDHEILYMRVRVSSDQKTGN